MFFNHQKALLIRFALIITLLGGVFGMASVGSANAVTFIVTNLDDSGPGSLRQAIADATPGDTILFAPSLAGGSIVLRSQLTIDKNLSIDGFGLDPQIILSGGFTTRIMEIVYPAQVTISRLTLQNGMSGNGGAVYSAGGFTATNSSFLNNSAGDGGGAIWGGTIKVINSVFSRNTAGRDGGAITGVNLDIRNTTFQWNEAYNDGGAISIYGDGTSTIVNSTIAQNQAGNSGGGIFMTGYPIVDIFNSTFAENTAVIGDEFILGETYHVGFANTIFVCNAASDDCYVPSGNTISNTNSILGIGVLQDYGLDELSDNGGPTETMALLPGSQLIDAGDDTVCANSYVNNLDQRGAARPQGSHCDIGAYEYASIAPTPTAPTWLPVTPTSTPTGTPTPTATPTRTPTRTPTISPTWQPITPTPTITHTATQTRTQTSTPTPTVSYTPTTSGTPISNCSAVYHAELRFIANTMSMSITNQTGIPLRVEDVFVGWNHDRGHLTGVDKSLQLQQASLNGVAFWNGNFYGPSFNIVPSGLSIPLGNSTILFTFHQNYDSQDLSERIVIYLETNGCQPYSINSDSAAVTHTPTITRTSTGTITVTSSATYTPTMTRTPSATQTNTSTVSFADVPAGHWARNSIEQLYEAGITGGCATNPLSYCPEGTVTRAQMAIFLLRGIHSSSYNPPGVGSSTGFADVSTTHWAAAWIKQLAAEGITSGCGNGNYCPEAPVTRAQMAVFLLRSRYGASYAPPAVGASTSFIDIPPTYWAAAWIKQLVTEGITAGCGTNIYCPEVPVTRAQMAVFLVKTFNLP